MEETVEKTNLEPDHDVSACKAPGPWLIAGCCGLMIAISGLGIWLICQGVSTSIKAESNLHLSLFSLELVERFVIREGQWPRSWAELEESEMRAGPLSREWAQTFTEVQKRIIIDFGVDRQDVARQDRMVFTAIRPKGPFYEYRDYGYVDSLQAAIRKSVSESQPISSRMD
jgi:hypothetical protein